MVPRKPPARQLEETYSYSFVDQAVLKNKGHRFGTGRETNTSKVLEAPGPNSYGN